MILRPRARRGCGTRFDGFHAETQSTRRKDAIRASSATCSQVIEYGTPASLGKVMDWMSPGLNERPSLALILILNILVILSDALLQVSICQQGCLR